MNLSQYTANVIGDTVSATPAKHDLHAVLCRNGPSKLDRMAFECACV